MYVFQLGPVSVFTLFPLHQNDINMQDAVTMWNRFKTIQETSCKKEFSSKHPIFRRTSQSREDLLEQEVMLPEPEDEFDMHIKAK